jgi:hypothetical protein
MGTAEHDEAKDVAMDVVGEVRHEIDPAVSARALRKTDWFLIPAMTIGCEQWFRVTFFSVVCP